MTQVIDYGDLLTFRGIIETLLKDELGLFDNGQKAIWVEPPMMPQALSCKGLQVVIKRYPNVLQTYQLINDQGFQNVDWIVTLTLFDLTTEGYKKLDSARDKIQRRFPRFRETIIIPFSNDSQPMFQDDTYPQITYRLNFSVIKNNILT